MPTDGQPLREIVARRNVILQDYYGDSEATKKVIGDGWFHTDDAALVHPDGHVEIRGGIQVVIVRGGEDVWSMEVARMPQRHPAVQSGRGV